MENLLDTILPTIDGVLGQIYLIRNQCEDKVYIGQTRTHRLNHGKYRPYGYAGRFQTHLTTAISNTKKSQCSYLYNAIRKYGHAHFTVELIETAPLDIMDALESKYIQEYNSLFPNGYNLTTGGKAARYVRANIPNELNPMNTTWRNEKKSEETKRRMSEGIKKSLADPKKKKQRMALTQQQHLQNKLKRFDDIVFNDPDFEKYITTSADKTYKTYFVVRIQGREVQFMGKYNTEDELKQMAVDFLTTLFNKGKNHGGLDNPQVSS